MMKNPNITEDNEQINREKELIQVATEKAEYRARTDLDVAVFFFAILCIIVILLSEGIQFEILAPIAALGLVLGWVMGWRKGKLAYEHFYDEELATLKYQQLGTAEGTLEELVQKALRERIR
ncbi:hypothetical protein ACFLWR_04025 [Chloroflexota bacterium]